MTLNRETLLLGGLVILLIVVILFVVFGTRRRSRGATGEAESLAAAGRPEDIAPWVLEGRRLFDLWQERIERLDELKSRLSGMAQEIEQLRAEIGQIDEMRARSPASARRASGTGWSETNCVKCWPASRASPTRRRPSPPSEAAGASRARFGGPPLARCKIYSVGLPRPASDAPARTFSRVRSSRDESCSFAWSSSVSDLCCTVRSSPSTLSRVGPALSFT